MASVLINEYYNCDKCKHAADHYGRGCDINAMYPLLLLMCNHSECPDYAFDPEKVHKQLEEKINAK